MKDQEVLKPIVDRILSLSERPGEQEKKALWADHQALKGTDRIPVCVYWEGIPKPQWDLMFGKDHLQCETETGREIEFYLKRVIWMAENVPDDHIVWPAVFIHSPMRWNQDWGVNLGWKHADEELGAKAIIAPFDDGIDLDRLKMPLWVVDEDKLKEKVECANKLVQERLQVEVFYENLGFSPYDTASQMRGLEKILFDFYDQPEVLHGLMNHITTACQAHHAQREKQGWINFHPSADKRYQMYYCFRIHCAHLPAKYTADNPVPKLIYEWPYVSAQTSSGLGPDMYREFVHNYNVKLAEPFINKTVYYHGCECLDQKVEIIKELPNLRRHHVSPWSSVEKAVEVLQGKVIMEVHSHPGKVFFGWNEDDMRKEIRGLIEKAQGHPMDLNLSDIHSVNGNPKTLGIWAKVARKECERYLTSTAFLATDRFPVFT
jgi:hypothetical protein